MQVLKPIVHETIWGGAKLSPYSGSDSCSIGHLYAFVDNSSMKSEIVAGPDSGKNIHQWFVEHRERYGLQRYEELPILAALVEARENLSIQVHPDDQRAKDIAGLHFGKNESFYTLEAPPNGKMYNGCLATSVEQMEQRVRDGRVLEVVDVMPCEAGDYVYIEGGTLHAAAAGSLHFEIEENCELTYRFFDYDRVGPNGVKRPLQVENALKCLDVDKKSVARKYRDAPIEERMYITQLIRGQTTFFNETDMFAFAVMIKGDCEYLGTRVLPGTAILLEPGDSLDVAQFEFIVAWPKREPVHA